MAAFLASEGFGQFTQQQYPASNESPVAKDRKTGSWHVLSIHLTQMLVHEVQVSYERSVLDRLSLEGSLGARIPSFDDYEVYNGTYNYDFDVNYKAYPFIRSYYGALGIKLHLVTPAEPGRGPLYVAAVPFYRYNLFPRTTYAGPAPSSSESYARDESKYQRIPGLKLLMGWRMPAWRIDPHHAFFLDLFGGASVRRIMTTTTTYGSVYGTADPALIQPLPEPETKQKNTPFSTVQLGAKLSFAWTR
jgi:hypothetical protein